MSTPEINGIFAEHYLLKEQLVSGRVVEVWKAEDWSAEGAPVMLRLYAPQIRLDSHSLDMLLKEQEELSALSHPHLLSPSGFGVHGGIPYEVVPLQPQRSLTQALLLDGPPPEQEIAQLIRQVGAALQYLHQQQPMVLHRQISPDTILLSNEGSYLLSAPSLSNQLRMVLHRATGTPLAQGNAYAAPELFGSHPVYGEASDIFAFGVTLYELCTGETPWLGNGGLSLSQGAEVPIVPAPYSRTLSNLVRACLHPDPEKRPSAKVLTEEADYFLTQGNWKPYGAFGDVTAESIVYEKRSKWWPIAFALLLVLGGLAAAYYYFYLKQPGSPEKSSETRTAVLPVQDRELPQDTLAESPATQAPAKQSAARTVPAPQQKAPAAKSKTRSTTNSSPTAPTAARTSYPRPTSLDGYLNGLLNEEIPLNVRDQWRPVIRKYFSNDAIIYAKLNNEPFGSFGVVEFIDILLSSEEGNSIVIDDIIREKDGKIEEISVSIISVQ